MSIDVAHFTPWVSAAGGLLIGASASLLILGLGRVMGASGIFAGALETRGVDERWRLWLLAGLVLAPVLARIIWSQTAPVISASAPTLILAGALVGFGARLGSGCTSGHGVCGVARLSPRSLVATALFMGTGFLTVFLVRHVLA